MSKSERAEPEASRPGMPPEYGILDPAEGKGLLPWNWAKERLSNSRNYWLSTTRPGGGPHVVPVWGTWLDEKFYFSTFARSQKARNLAADPRCVVCTDGADEAVIVEGIAKEVTDPAVSEKFKAAYEQKYQEEIDTAQGVMYAVQPRVAFAFISTAEDFPGSATRWRFPND